MAGKPTTRRQRPIEERLWSKVQKTETCWLWTGAVKQGGYGVMQRGRRGEGLVSAYRVAYELLVGPVPEGMSLDHKCHEPRCVNPDHLQPVTHQQNHENRGRSYSNSGLRGVYQDRRTGRYIVYVTSRGVRYYGGSHSTKDDANAAAVELRSRLMTNNLKDRDYRATT